MYGYFEQRYILYRDLKLLLNIDICPRYDCRSGRQVNRGKKSIFLSAAESVISKNILLIFSSFGSLLSI